MGDPIQQRENLYKLIISQLRYDGLEAVAATLSKIINTTSPCPPSARLHQVVNLGIQAENDGIRPEPHVLPGLTAPTASAKGIDMEYEPEGSKNHSENGESSNTADEGFLSNLKLQKVTDNAGPSKLTPKQDQPSEEDIQKHIYLITRGRKTRPVPDEINVILSEDASTTVYTDICASVKRELQRFNISQEVFAKVVIGKTQGYLSEMLRQGEKAFNSPDKIFGKGQKNFDTMREFLKLPEHERRQQYAAKCEELRLEKLKKRESEQGSSFESPKKKPRQQIPSDAKEVMERFYDAENKYLTAERREALASQLRIPEQSVSDFFKNLRSRRKYEERMQGILSSCGSDSGADEESEEVMTPARPDNGACGSEVSPRKAVTRDTLNNKPQVAKSSPLNSELVSQDSTEEDLGESIYHKILALGRKQTSRGESQNSCAVVKPDRVTSPSPSRNSEHSPCASVQGQGPSSGGAPTGVFSGTSFELVDRDQRFITHNTKMEVFHPISGEELFVVQLEENAVPSSVHLSHQL